MAIYNKLYLTEFFINKKKPYNKNNPVKHSRKYGLLTEQEFNKCVSIIKKHTNKYPLVKENSSFDYDDSICKSFSDYLKTNDDCVAIAFFIFGLDNIPTEKIDESDIQSKKYYKDIKADFEKLPFNVELKIIPDAEWDIICICSKKPFEK